MNKISFVFIFTFFYLFFAPFEGFSQSSVVSQLKNYTACKIDASGEESDCQEKIGQLLYRKISVVPNKEITVYPKGQIGDEKSIKTTWNKSRLKMNEDEDLYIYDFATTDLNKPNGSSILIIMRLDYTVQAVIYYLNYEGVLNKFTMLDR